MSDVFFRVGGKKKLDIFFPAKKARNERWEVRPVMLQDYFWYYFEVLFCGGSRNSTSKGPL